MDDILKNLFGGGFGGGSNSERLVPHTDLEEAVLVTLVLKRLFRSGI